MEEGDLALGLLVAEVPHLSLVLLLQLSLLELEVLFLSLNNNCKLGLLRLRLLDESLQLGDFLKVLDLLVRDLLIQHILLLLVPGALHQLLLPSGVPHSLRSCEVRLHSHETQP